MEYQIHTLKNGIRVVHTPSNNAVAYCGLIINTGSRDERDNEIGLAHFIEHVVFKGTKKRRAYHILTRLDEVGGELNAYTTKEETTIHASFLTEYFERASELIFDMVFNSTFPDREIEKEKEVIVDEISSYKDTPSELIFDEFEEQLFPNDSIGHNILGTPESISAFNGKSAQTFMARNFNTDQMVFSVYGNMPFKQVVRIAEKYFGTVPENIRHENLRQVSAYQKSDICVQKETHQGHIVLGNVAYDNEDHRRLTLHLLNNMLGGPCMNSRLSMLLREKNGIAYNIESSYTPYCGTGIFTIYFGTDSENIERSLKLIGKELNSMCNKPLSDMQLRKAQRQLIGQLAMSTDNGENQMLSIGKAILLYNQVDPMEIVSQKIYAITPADLLNVANEIIDPQKLSRLIYQ